MIAAWYEVPSGMCTIKGYTTRRVKWNKEMPGAKGVPTIIIIIIIIIIITIIIIIAIISITINITIRKKEIPYKQGHVKAINL